MADMQKPVAPGHRIGIPRAIMLAAPHVFGAAVVGLALYNPSQWCVWEIVVGVILRGLGVVSDVDWYYQPVYWLVIIGAIALGIVGWFHWQIARGEWSFLLLFVVLWVAFNGLVLSVAVIAADRYLFSWQWVHWQIVPALFAGIYFAVKLPKIRRRYTGAITAGGGTLDVRELDEHHAGHQDHAGG